MTIKTIVFTWVLLVSLQCSIAQIPKVFLTKGERLAEVKKRIQSGDAEAKSWLDHLLKESNKDLDRKPLSVMDKKQVPPSGDKHDYMSLAPYFWPDPANPNGAYIRKDGERNPEIYGINDHKAVDELQKAVKLLSLAYYFSGQEVYAKKAAQLLRVFFLDTATKMNPNMKYSQAIKGVNDGRGTGILDTRSFADVVSSVGLLEGCKSWTSNDKEQLKAWFTEYYDWMINSKGGKDERNAKNNHGIWFDTQMLSIGLYLGKDDFVKDYLKSTLARIDVQQETDGRQPLELVRTTSLGYSTFCLSAWFTAANLADKVGVDIWNYQTKDGKGIKKALDWLLPYALGEKDWTYQQIHPYKRGELFPIVLQASAHYKEKKYDAAVEQLKAEKDDYYAEIMFGK